MVTLRGVRKRYVRGREAVEVLHGVDMEIPDGDFVAESPALRCSERVAQQRLRLVEHVHPPAHQRAQTE